MRSLSPVWAALVGPFLLLALTPKPAIADDTETPDPVRLRPAPDDLSGHIILAPKLAYSVPAGSAESGYAHRAFTTSGASFGADLAFGISRYVALHGRFDYGTYKSNAHCPTDGTCEASSIAFGVGIDYHIVNGASLAPWLRVGVGYRTMHHNLRWNNFDEKLTYAGFDWLHLAMGADWYPTTLLGLGPFMALDIGTYGSRPDTAPPQTSGERGSTVHTLFSLGIRVVVDPMR